MFCVASMIRRATRRLCKNGLLRGVGGSARQGYSSAVGHRGGANGHGGSGLDDWLPQQGEKVNEARVRLPSGLRTGQSPQMRHHGSLHCLLEGAEQQERVGGGGGQHEAQGLAKALHLQRPQGSAICRSGCCFTTHRSPYYSVLCRGAVVVASRLSWRWRRRWRQRHRTRRGQGRRGRRRGTGRLCAKRDVARGIPKNCPERWVVGQQQLRGRRFGVCVGGASRAVVVRGEAVPAGQGRVPLGPR
mmetsp:Transcript_54452/g.101804  ORF Transcript_54452/g.101804 Transcript_54452/m.101804 type:complete len:245 (-) Transcript_54452:133-867(-)